MGLGIAVFSVLTIAFVVQEVVLARARKEEARRYKAALADMPSYRNATNPDAGRKEE